MGGGGGGGGDLSALPLVYMPVYSAFSLRSELFETDI